MSFRGPVINKLNGGLGRTEPTDDSVFAIAAVIATADLPAGTAHNTAYPLLQPSDAEALGFDAAFDANNDLLVYSEIVEYFRLAPNAKLYLIPVADSQTPVQIMTLAAFRAVIRAKTDIKGIGILGTTETQATLAPMVENVQAQIDLFYTNDIRLIDFVLLQGNGTSPATAVGSYIDLRTKVAPNVLISIAQDPAVAALDSSYAKYASIGSVLGMAAARQVSENWGSVDIVNKPPLKKGNENYPLTEGTIWADAALSDGTKVSTLTQADKDALTNKGYIFAGAYPGYGGIYLNSSPACVEADSDYANVEYTRTWNKAARLIRRRLMPKIKGKIKKDPTTGYIRPTTIASWEGIVRKALGEMETADEISGYDCYIDPKQIVNDQNPLKVKATVVVDDIAHDISVDLGLSTKL